MRALVPCLALLVGCQAAPPIAPNRAPADDARAAWEAQRALSERLQAGVEHFVTLAASRPEFSAVAGQAAHHALLHCERARPGFTCPPALVARLTDTLRGQRGALAPTRGWVVEAETTDCASLAEALTTRGAPGGPLRVTLRDCAFTASHSPWKADRCLTNTPGCPDGSAPREGGGATAVARTCPCQAASRTTRYSVRGTWQHEGGEGRFAQQGGGTTGERSDDAAPRELSDGDARALAVDELESSLLRVATTLATQRAPGADQLALECTRVAQVVHGDPWGLTAPACATAFERAPAPTVAAAPHVLVAPTVDTSSSPWRLALRTPETRRADAEALSRALPGWRFTVGATGFLTSAELVHAPDTVEALAAAAVALSARAHLQLGFPEVPPVTPHDTRVFIGDDVEPLELRRCASCAGFEASLVAPHAPLHRWLARCPEADAPKLLAPWLGRAVKREIPGAPCDPGRGVRCKSTPPRTETVKLTRATLIARPVAVLMPSSQTEALVHCALELSGAGVVLGEDIPRYIDVLTGAALSPRGEDELPQKN